MSINYNIYGIEEVWRNAHYTPNVENKNKKAGFTYVNDNELNVVGSYLRVGVWGGHLSFDTPIDKSLSYCGMDENAPLSSFYGITKNDNVYDYDDDKTIKRSLTNWCIAERISNAGVVDGLQEMYCRFNYDVDHKYMYWLNGNNYKTNPNYNQEPYVKIVPKNQVMLIYVDAYNDNFSSKITATLNDYITTYAETYPNIVSVWASLYFGETNRSVNAGQGNPNTWYSTPFVMILDKNTFNENDEKFDYCYSLFETYGYNFIPLMISDKRVSVYNGIYLNSGEIGFTFGDKYEIHTNNNTYIPYLVYSTNFKEKALKAAAYYGLFFTDRLSVAENGAYIDNNMYLGIIDANGITHGEYTRGNLNTTNATFNYNDMHDSPYDYKKQSDNTKYSDDTEFHLTLSTGAFTKLFVLDETNVNKLSSELFRIVNDMQGTSATEYAMKTFLTNNPIDCIISLKKFPINPMPVVGNPTYIRLGMQNTTVEGKLLLSPTWIYYFDFSVNNDTSLVAVNGDSFLDYEPYTKCTVVVPFCGSVEIPCCYLYDNGGLRVALAVDFVTGACTAYIIVGGKCIETVQGNCAIDLPVSGIQSATLDSNINNTINNYNSTAISSALTVIGGGVSFVTGVASGNIPMIVAGMGAIIGGSAKGAQAEKRTNYELQHMQTPFKSVSAASGALAQTGDYRCKLLITRPKLSEEYDAEIYGNTIGFACLINGHVRDFSGLTIGDIKTDNINCTVDEKRMIENLFATGVYL